MTSNHREQTNVSLRLERDKADQSSAKLTSTLEEVADEVVRVARERADEVIAAAREQSDRALDSSRPAQVGTSAQQRDSADVEVASERIAADAILERERGERRRCLADFLAVERENTDGDLLGERAQADAAIAARDLFLSTVSHDLRSLISGLAMNAELIITSAPEGGGGEKMRKYAGASQRLVARMNRLINDLLDIASIEAGKLAVVLEDLDARKLLAETAESFGPIAARRRIELDVRSPALPLLTRLDGGRILQVLANLVSNAIKFSSDGSKISLLVERTSQEIQFAVGDTGIGLSEEDARNVFERFRQITPDRRGLGLGLHISKCIVEAHGGRMWVRSQRAKGSTFYFALPDVTGSGT